VLLRSVKDCVNAGERVAERFEREKPCLHALPLHACDVSERLLREVRKDCAGVILYCAEKATWMAGEAIQILGGNGYINDYPTGRLWRDAKLYEIGAGTSEIRRMLIGRELFSETL